MAITNMASAQSSQLITYHGQLRTLVSDQRLGGNILNSDSLSPKRGAYGSIFLDLGINVMPNEDFKLLAEFRMRNVIGENNQQTSGGVTVNYINSLVDTRMIFRQIRAEGTIRDVVDYQIGDIDLSLTKFTLFNSDEMFHDYESDIFKERRVIPHYENFQNGNNWRLQGMNFNTEINFRSVIRKLEAQLFATRTRMNNGDGVPDRFLIGGKLNITQSRYVTLGVNWINMFDVPGTALNDTLVNYNNNVVSTNYAFHLLNKPNYGLSIVGENGISSNKYFRDDVDTTKTKNDFFIDLGIKTVYKPKQIKLTASYLNVGHNFTSPGAQTLRLRPQAGPMFFNTVSNGTVQRDLNMFDRTTDETVYNQRIHTGLMAYIPVYGNVLPYGMATPNRNGLVFNIGRDLDTSNVLSFNVGGALLSELVSEGDSIGQNLRKFTQLKGGVALNVGKLAGFNKGIVFSTGARLEQTKREGAAFIDFQSLLLDAGLSVEVLRDVYLLGGYKYLQGNGVEVITLRDEFGDIEDYTPYIYNTQQSILSGAVRVRIFGDSFGSIEYNRTTIKNKIDDSQSYNIGNLFINFTLRF